VIVVDVSHAIVIGGCMKNPKMNRKKKTKLNKKNLQRRILFGENLFADQRERNEIPSDLL
jgi:hypothetical protein